MKRTPEKEANVRRGREKVKAWLSQEEAIKKAKKANSGHRLGFGVRRKEESKQNRYRLYLEYVELGNKQNWTKSKGDMAVELGVGPENLYKAIRENEGENT